MKTFKIILLFITSVGAALFVTSVSHAACFSGVSNIMVKPLFAADMDVKKGKTLFDTPGLGGSASGKSCSSGHTAGRGLERAADKTEFNSGEIKGEPSAPAEMP
ncbi:MAG: hypothetical protein HY756_00770 [Nitrospirae bacterium]|nr:hypothetical protein [Nitrospirota bacterium]